MLHVYKSSSKSSTALVHVFLTPQKTQKNHSGQQFWPNYLHAIAFRKRCASNVWFRGLDMQSVPSPAWPNSEEANAAGYVRSCYEAVVSSNGTGLIRVCCTRVRNARQLHAHSGQKNLLGDTPAFMLSATTCWLATGCPLSNNKADGSDELVRPENLDNPLSHRPGKGSARTMARRGFSAFLAQLARWRGGLPVISATDFKH